MAWFVMRNQSRFLFSHDHAYKPCHASLGHSIPSWIVDVGLNAFVLNWIHNYIYRPQELDEVNFYDFVEQFDVKHILKSNEDDIMWFSSKDHPLHQLRVVIECTNTASPLLSHLNFPNSSEFDGNIMGASVPTTPIMEKFVKSVLCLFVSFQDKKQFDASHQEQSCFQLLVQDAMERNAISS
jgi:hypothetical protein